MQIVQPIRALLLQENGLKHFINERRLGRKVSIEQGLRNADATCQFARLNRKSRLCKVVNGGIQNLLAARLGRQSFSSGIVQGIHRKLLLENL